MGSSLGGGRWLSPGREAARSAQPKGMGEAVRVLTQMGSVGPQRGQIKTDPQASSSGEWSCLLLRWGSLGRSPLRGKCQEFSFGRIMLEKPSLGIHGDGEKSVILQPTLTKHTALGSNCLLRVNSSNPFTKPLEKVLLFCPFLGQGN